MGDERSYDIRGFRVLRMNRKKDETPLDKVKRQNEALRVKGRGRVPGNHRYDSGSECYIDKICSRYQK